MRQQVTPDGPSVHVLFHCRCPVRGSSELMFELVSRARLGTNGTGFTSSGMDGIDAICGGTYISWHMMSLYSFKGVKLTGSAHLSVHPPCLNQNIPRPPVGSGSWTSSRGWVLPFSAPKSQNPLVGQGPDSPARQLGTVRRAPSPPGHCETTCVTACFCGRPPDLDHQFQAPNSRPTLDPSTEPLPSQTRKEYTENGPPFCFLPGVGR